MNEVKVVELSLKDQVIELIKKHSDLKKIGDDIFRFKEGRVFGAYKVVAGDMVLLKNTFSEINYLCPGIVVVDVTAAGLSIKKSSLYGYVTEEFLFEMTFRSWEDVDSDAVLLLDENYLGMFSKDTKEWLVPVGQYVKCWKACKNLCLAIGSDNNYHFFYKGERFFVESFSKKAVDILTCLNNLEIQTKQRS